jgi:hypothetical protein
MVRSPPIRKQTAADDFRFSRHSGVHQLLLWLLAIGLVWFLLLPWLANRPSVAARLRWLDEHQVDPSAMYYTEVEALKPVLRRLHDRPRNDGQGQRR